MLNLLHNRWYDFLSLNQYFVSIMRVDTINIINHNILACQMHVYYPFQKEYYIRVIISKRC